MSIKSIQQDLKDLGYYKLTVDGDWGDGSKKAWNEAKAFIPKKEIKVNGDVYNVAWGSKVSAEFLAIAVRDALDLDIDPSDYMSIMAFESDRTFSPSIQNKAGAPYWGLIQFGEKAAADLKTTTGALRAMTAIQQLVYVHKWFARHRGKLKTLADLYMSVLYPVAVGKPDSYVLFAKKLDENGNDITPPRDPYTLNRGLDINKDGKVTKIECATRVIETRTVGLSSWSKEYVYNA